MRFRNSAVGCVCALLITSASLNSAEAHGEKVIYSFSGSDGDFPSSGIIMDTNGNLFGTTKYGGTSNSGTVFKLTPGGKEKVLYAFTGGYDGNSPVGGVVMDGRGNLYGTTMDGCANNLGMLFKLTPHGKRKVLYCFGSPGDAYNPDSPLTMDSVGNFYGTSAFGGAADSGAVFKATPQGGEEVIYSFTGGSDGYNPEGGVIKDANGYLYGTTQFGGTGDAGTVFKLTESNGKKTVLYSFTGGSDGEQPLAGLIMDDNGNLYGTTSVGGEFEQGVVFEVTPQGQQTVLYAFSGGPDGGNPQARLIMDASGNIYGTTEAGGTSNAGTVFKLTPAGEETVLYSFNGGDDGAHPMYGLIMDARQNLYGTTAPGTGNGGTVFKVGH